MSDKIEAMLRQAITDARSAGDLPAFEVDELGVERPADSSNGDWTSTVALRSARLAHMEGENDAFVHQSIIRQYGLRPGDRIEGSVGPGRSNSKYPPLQSVRSVNDREPESMIDETIQRFVPGREGQLRDVCIDLAGIAFGLLVFWVVSRHRARHQGVGPGRQAT